MDVSIIMINYNTYELTKNAIESVINYTSSINYEIILIDNNSPDKSGDELKNYFGEKITYIQAGENLGTSKSFNKGLEMTSGKYILWLNTDILIKDNFIYKLFVFMEKNEQCGICGGNLVDFNNKPAHSFLKFLPSLKSVKKNLGLFNIVKNKLFKNHIKHEYNFSDKPLEVGYITGADMMIRRTVIDRIGGFDEDIFMYAEETEFTFRMKKSTDYKVFSVPEAVMQHLEGGSFGAAIEFNEWKFTTKLNGDCVYFKKCYGQEAMFKYLRILKRGYSKLAKINKFLGKNKKSEIFEKSRNIVIAKIMECNQ